MDQRINDRGIMVDQELIGHAVACDLLYKETVTKKAYEISGLENPNSVSQLKDWLNEKGIEVDSLAKAAVEELVENTQGDVAEMMKLRLAMSKTSVKKYEAMERSVCPDGRVHGLLQFYGANRTGRWAGRLVQIHNLPQNHMEDLELARSLVKEGRYDLVELLYDSTPDVLSELIRTAFVARPGCRFIVSDFSAIEARVMGYLAGEGWVMEEFRGTGKIYEQTASKMFHIPIGEITKGSPYRARGKVASLACQYGGAEGALISMGALNFVEEEELKGLVQSWRAANPHIVNYWYEIDGAVKAAVKERKMTKVGMVMVYYQSGMLKIALPSGRVLSYVRPRMTVNRFGSESVSYEGIGTNRKWTRIESYGAKFCENIVQATARDVLAEAMLRLEKKPDAKTGGDTKTGRATDEYRKAFWNGMRNKVLSYEVQNALTIGTDSEGGCLVPDEYEKKLVEALEEEVFFRNLATVIKTSSGDRKIPIVTSKGEAAWIDEGGQFPESDDSFGQTTISAFKLATMIKVSDELLNDSVFNIEQYISREFGRRIGTKEEEAFFIGDGKGKPTGIFNATGGAETGVTSTGTSITFDDVMDLYYSLRAPYRNKAVWLLNDSTVKAIRKLKDGNGNYIWQPSVREGEPDKILNRPYRTSIYVPELAAGNRVMAFGDYSYYWIADRQGRSFKRLNELYATTGQVGFLASERVDGKLILSEAVKTLDIKAAGK